MVITAAQAQSAYLKILDANDFNERAQLLKYVLSDARTSMLFMLNCSPNQIESDAAFNQVVNEPKYCYELLKKNIKGLTSQQRLRAIASVVKDPDLAWDVACGSNLTHEEKEIIYKTHYAHYLKDKSINNYWTQWNTFGDIFPETELDHFVDMVYDCETVDSQLMGETLLKYGKLNAAQREKLDSKFVASTLRG